MLCTKVVVFSRALSLPHALRCHLKDDPATMHRHALLQLPVCSSSSPPPRSYPPPPPNRSSGSGRCTSLPGSAPAPRGPRARGTAGAPPARVCRRGTWQSGGGLGRSGGAGGAVGVCGQAGFDDNTPSIAAAKKRTLLQRSAQHHPQTTHEDIPECTLLAQSKLFKNQRLITHL